MIKITDLPTLFTYMAERVFVGKYNTREGNFTSFKRTFKGVFPEGLCCVIGDLYEAEIIGRSLADDAEDLLHEYFRDDAQAAGNYSYYFGHGIRGTNDQRVAAALLLAEIAKDES